MLLMKGVLHSYGGVHHGWCPGGGYQGITKYYSSPKLEGKHWQAATGTDAAARTVPEHQPNWNPYIYLHWCIEIKL